MNINLSILDTSLLIELSEYLTNPDTLYGQYKDEFTCAYNSFFENIGINHYHLFANISK
jgi:hypothetical protein